MPIAYFGNLTYFWYLFHHKKVWIYTDEKYPKQTIRNRCSISTANGVIHLSIPVEKPFGSNSKTKEVCISKAENWQKNHWKTIESAYQNSPYFEFYKDKLEELIHSDEENLVNYNLAILNYLIDKIGLVCEIQCISTSEKITFLDDFSKKNDDTLHYYPYIQTFSDRFNFIPNLSVLDLLCNEGPNAISILKEMKNK